MTFRRFSLRGFRSEFDIRRQIDGFEQTYSCRATLYRGKHIRRKVDRISTGIPTSAGIATAQDLTWEFRDRLIARHRLEPVGSIEITEAARTV